MKAGKILQVSAVLGVFLFFFAGLKSLEVEKKELSNPIIIGTSLPLKTEGQLIVRGMSLVFDQVNEQGGIQGRSIQLVAVDNEKDAAKNRKNVAVLQEKTDLFSHLFISDLKNEFAAQLEEGTLLFFAPEELTPSVVSGVRGLLMTRAPLQTELQALLDYAIKTRRKRSLAIFYENSTFGFQAKKIVEKLLHDYVKKNSFIQLVGTASYPQNTVNIDGAIQEMMRLNPDAIICLSRRHATYNFIAECMNNNLFNVEFFGSSYLEPIQRMLFQDKGIRLCTTETLPSLRNRELLLIKQFRDIMNKKHPLARADSVTFSGYFGATVLVDLMRKVAGPLSRESLINTAEQLTTPYQIDGLTFKFDPESRSLYSAVSIKPDHRTIIPVGARQ